MKTLFSAVVLAFLFGLVFQANQAFAQCKPIYGGGEACLPQRNITLDKKIQAPNSSNLSDGLKRSDPRFKPGDVINFQIIVTNNTAQNITLDIRDNFPRGITYVSGTGSFNNSNRVLSFKVSDLKPRETRKFVVVGRVEEVQNDQCLTNYVQSSFRDTKIDDSVGFCVTAGAGVQLEQGETKGGTTTKGGLPVQRTPSINQTPATGPGILSIAGLASLAGAGLFLRKRIKI